MPEIMKLYHGSTAIIDSLEIGKGNTHNDYGLGFYCTESPELAKEWACSSRSGGFVNTYSLDTAGLNIMNLTDPSHSILGWLAVIVKNRVFDITSQLAVEARAYLTKNFLPDFEAYDAIRGYRADDSYFAFAMDFLSNTISLRQLNRAMSLGSLGEQFVLKSSKAFETIHFDGSEPVDGSVYFSRRRKRDREAREQYLINERRSSYRIDDIFILDILRGEMKQGDARLQGDIPS